MKSLHAVIKGKLTDAITQNKLNAISKYIIQNSPLLLLEMDISSISVGDDITISEDNETSRTKVRL